MYRFFLIAVLLLAGMPAVSCAQPAIHFNEVSHDLGRVAQEEAIAYVFEFSNTGDRPLIIEKLTSS